MIPSNVSPMTASSADSTIALNCTSAFGLDAVRDVPRDTPGMNELLTFEQRVRAKEAVADRAVAVAHPDLDVAERLPARQAPRAVNDDLRVDAELRDVSAQVFIGLVAQQVELGPVGPEDRAVRRRPTNAHRRVLEELLELGLAAMRLRERLLAIAHVHRAAHHANDRAPPVWGTPARLLKTTG